MSLEAASVKTVEQLHEYVHGVLCAHENLLPDQFTTSSIPMMRKGRSCGLQFSLKGPRELRLGAVWATDHNVILFYDARGERFRRERLNCRLSTAADRNSEGSLRNAA
ncbi:hypothetical protein [Stratiformator vulcanicus]|uniref:Uncharacterized protein n=1 Tax=Stratiformator vulcanicus TaxID=2527980 RepID=A0A517QYN8_9PLAN|nr:hypothetical protein [Stratiformator vulcanicus]QDT36769.1 hypothetical protein Pan189_11320 [Stratiformator vulcanicus]